MKVTQLKTLSKETVRRIMQRSSGTNEAILPEVKKIMDCVRQKGDKALLDKYQKRYGSEIYLSVRVTSEEVKDAYKQTDQKTIIALRQMIKNITVVQQAQLSKKKEKKVIPEKGISVWREWRAIERVGLYIPGGKATYPSSVLMTGIPAKIAGCRDIIMCSPPQSDGRIPAATLVAADMIGITNIYKVGGVEAIAAMTYGTESIPAVYKIFGAGNSYVTAAKSISQKTISIDMPAGPSEVCIIADKTANPAFIAADLLADGEHGEDSACVLVTTSRQVAEQTISQIKVQLKNLATQERVAKSLENFGLIALVDSMEEAIQFVNNYAPEHLSIVAKNEEKIVSQIMNAGSVFVGRWTAKATGDYATGANHVLPTGGAAKMYPPLGVDGFGKWMQVQKCTKKGLISIRETIETIASVERLPAHKESVSIRFNKKIYEK